MDTSISIILLANQPSRVYYLPNGRMYLGSHLGKPGAIGFDVIGDVWAPHRVNGDLRITLRSDSRFVAMKNGVPTLMSPEPAHDQACVPMYDAPAPIEVIPSVMTTVSNIIDPGYYVEQKGVPDVNLALVDFEHFMGLAAFDPLIVNNEVRFGVDQEIPPAPRVDDWPVRAGKVVDSDQFWVLVPTVISQRGPKRQGSPQYEDWNKNGIIAGIQAARAYARFLGGKVFIRQQRDADLFALLSEACDKVEIVRGK